MGRFFFEMWSGNNLLLCWVLQLAASLNVKLNILHRSSLASESGSRIERSKPSLCICLCWSRTERVHDFWISRNAQICCCCRVGRGSVWWWWCAEFTPVGVLLCKNFLTHRLRPTSVTIGGKSQSCPRFVLCLDLSRLIWRLTVFQLYMVNVENLGHMVWKPREGFFLLFFTFCS